MFRKVGKVRKVRKFLAVVSAAVLVVSGVAGDYCTAYAAVSITEAGEYFLQMMCSAVGVYIDKSNIGLVLNAIHHVADQQALIGSPEFQKQVDYMLSLSPADRIDETFSNSFLKNLCGVFRESMVNEDGHGGGGISLPVPSDIFVGEGEFSVDLVKFTVDIRDALSPVVMYCFNDSNGLTFNVFFVSEYRFRMSGNLAYYQCGNYYADGYVLSKDYLDAIKSRGAMFLNDISTTSQFRAWLASSEYAFPDVKVTQVSAERVWIDAYDDAMLHVPAITAPITIPADTTEMQENAKAVAAADNADALYKALAAAGISIDIGMDIPDETEKPTDADITDDNTGAIGKSLSDILAAITGLADKVAAIPGEVADFFSLDTDAIAEAADRVQEAFLKQFGGITQLAEIFQRSYEFGMEAPVYTMPVPEILRFAYPDADEIVVLDLRPYATYMLYARGILTAIIYVLFAKWLLDQFDVKLHVG